ncbi:ABC1 kinase family protein [Anaerotalea alkaliphila]|uniref:AarF/ABC1/UbiB kinase family protein n=1 Tax=Anaerotalea alkaliphila TaxID=2662126 RepID=A0A7X5HV55_9FIRM|nr:AarF/UbiB family protein [Anaerotalea alkaliphila]NDL67240.1 AarF/ABC1/UbiB kinase family protein [Anaerotalea alkaliphila]
MTGEARPKGGTDRARFLEILSLLRKHRAAKGLTPVKLRALLEDLGPTYMKLGQVMAMRSDLLPAAYCQELKKLHSEAAPMPVEEVYGVIARSLDPPLGTLFPRFDPVPLGAASIAQVHLAELADGTPVVVKVQRPGIHETMRQDVALIRRALGLARVVGGTGDVVDFGMVLDEIWAAAQEEMDFRIEAGHMETFARNNRDVAYVDVPRVFRGLSTGNVLVMEHIRGIPVTDTQALRAEGYDLEEIGAKLAQNYLKQVVEDGFFHADPHPGNLRIRDGRIVWIDFGMMGHLSPRNRQLLDQGVRAMARKDPGALKDVLLAMGALGEGTDQNALYGEIDDLLTKYGTVDLASIDMGSVLEDFLHLARRQHIVLPGGVSMLGRGMATLEGVLSVVSPGISLLDIAAGRMAGRLPHREDWERQLLQDAAGLAAAGHKALGLPVLLSDLLKMGAKGQGRMHLELTPSKALDRTAYWLVGRLTAGMVASAMLVGSGILCTTDLTPRWLGVPALGLAGFGLSILLAAGLLLGIWRER